MNWGKGLAISMIGFILFIVGMGFWMMRNNDSLYEKDYYQKGEQYTQTMVEKKNGQSVELRYTAGGLHIDLQEPGSLESISLKHMANGEHDRRLTNDKDMIQRVFDLDVTDLEPGLWVAEVRGTLNKEMYLSTLKFSVE